ncbi:hypothetical protein [Paraburkholderia caribensis]|uniref:hypothetical protein n=1 Tax=Paraburkholderia caribensis TaxID=75105 RepID=UPI00285E6E86|nr:hypothetical protein [Paraburkholderia caribensis]MDR6384793.1 hypothetical protein [Paraburkholderia caribensis]
MNTFEQLTAASAASDGRRGGPHYRASRHRRPLANEFIDNSLNQTQLTVAVAGNTRKAKSHAVTTPTKEVQVWRPENGHLTKRRSSLSDENLSAASFTRSQR